MCCESFVRWRKAVGGRAIHAVFVCSVVDDALFLVRRDLPRKDTQRDGVLLAEVSQDGLVVCAGWVFAQRPNAAEAGAAEKMVRAELHDPRRDHVEKFLNFCILKRRRL